MIPSGFGAIPIFKILIILVSFCSNHIMSRFLKSFFNNSLFIYHIRISNPGQSYLQSRWFAQEVCIFLRVGLGFYVLVPLL
jgi:hypothetical protein